MTNNNEMNPMAEYRPLRRRKRKKILVYIQLLLSILFMTVLGIADILPINYMVVSGLILLVLFVFTFSLYQSRRGRSVGRFFGVLIVLALIAGNFYLIRTTSVLSAVTGANVRVDNYSVIVLADDPAGSLQDVADRTLTVSESDLSNSTECLEKIGKELGQEVIYDTASGYTESAGRLLWGESSVILFNEAYREMVKEDYPDFDTQTRVIYSIKLKHKLTSGNKKVDVTDKCFAVYVSGIDVYGDIAQTSRSDVNIIAVVNPKTHQVLLVSTPRDAYIPLAMNGQMDKLTHAGLYGVEESMKVLENLYGVELNYSMRVNFSGFEQIVDALGGITIENESAFTSVDGYYYEAGTLELSGTEALHYARERKAFADGDLQRGRNQMKVIKAIIKKATSPAIITGYNSILNSVDGCFETSMSSDGITALCKQQIEKGGDWNVVNYAVIGTPDIRDTYSYTAKPVDVVLLDEAAVAEAKRLIQAVQNGEILDQQ